MSLLKKPPAWLPVLLATLVIAGALSWKFIAQRSSSDRLSDPIQRGPIVESVYGIGTVTANNSFQLKPGTTLTVRRLFVKEGEHVERGQRLVELESAEFTAPFSGTVTSVPSKVGETVYPQTVVLNLVDLKDRYLVVSLEQRAAILVRRNQKAKVSFDNMREASYDGQVESVYSNNNSFLVRVAAPDLPPQILPGMTADVAIATSEPRDALVIPVSAIEEGHVTLATGGGRFRKIPVSIGLIDGAVAEVLSGEVKPGDRLLLHTTPKS